MPSKPSKDFYDVIIVGGGPAGLSAALILGRCLRQVLLVDNGKQRNLYSHALHGYLTRDGIPPKDFLQLSHDELNRYPSVERFCGEVVSAKKTEDGFEVCLMDGEACRSSKLLIATGVVDSLPQFEGFLDFYGTSVHICPYCDAFEKRDLPIAVYGKGLRGYKQAMSLNNWTKDLVLLTNGPVELDAEQLSRLEKCGIRIIDEEIERLTGKDGKMEKIIFKSGKELPRDALFFNTGSFIRSKLLEQLGCEFEQNAGVITGKYETTNVPGLYVAGNICREVQLVIVAASEGAEAALGINTALNQEHLDKYLQGSV